MRIYVLNLARAVGRRADIVRAAAAAGVALDFIEAVDGRTLTDVQRDLVDHRRRRRITPYLLSDNEIGCWLSHRRAMQALIDSGNSMAAILEDDVALLPDFPHVLEALQHQGGLFDVVTLYRNFQRDPRFERCRTLTCGVSLGRIAPMQTGAVGYVITRQAAKKFLAATPRFTHAVDKEMHRYWASGLDIYALSQPVVTHDDAGHSYLSETRLDHRPKERGEISGCRHPLLACAAFRPPRGGQPPETCRLPGLCPAGPRRGLELSALQDQAAEGRAA